MSSHTYTATRHSTVRLSDIAKQTGYSLATVSKVINGRDDVSEAAQQAISNALRESGYVRRTTPSKQRNVIEIAFENFDNVWALEIMRGVMNEAKLHDLNVSIAEGGSRSHPNPSWLNRLIRHQTLGALLVFSNLSQDEQTKLQARGIPFVIFDPSGDPSPETISVQADNWSGGLLAARHLLALGHQRIGIIMGPESMLCSRARFDGFTSALAGAGISKDPELIMEGDFTTAGGYAQAMALLQEEKTRPTAIFAESDLMAMGVYEAARQLDIRIPQELSVIGFDDVQTSAFIGPPLTTIRQPLRDMSAAATRMILDASAGKQVTSLIMPTSLIIRDSVAAPLP